MFRDDFEFHDAAGPSHHGAKAMAAPEAAEPALKPVPVAANDASQPAHWLPAAEKELQKVPFFVRGKARRNTESFAAPRGIREIDVTTLYEAKAHYAR
jgi:light-independent protochlorophyllide reductase subunit B